MVFTLWSQGWYASCIYLCSQRRSLCSAPLTSWLSHRPCDVMLEAGRSAGYTVITPWLRDHLDEWIQNGPFTNNPQETGALLDQLGT